jgi:hypothetical protein
VIFVANEFVAKLCCLSTFLLSVFFVVIMCNFLLKLLVIFVVNLFVAKMLFNHFL